MYRDDKMWMDNFQPLMLQAKRYVKTSTEIYEHQRQHGRHVLHEHPWLATSWQMECIKKI